MGVKRALPTTNALEAAKVMRQECSRTAVSEEIVRRAQRGDIDAFEEIYRMTSGRVYAQCLRFMHNAADAEDLTQEVFLQLYRKIATYRGEAAFSTWLHRVTLNAVLMRIRCKALPLTSIDAMENDGMVHQEERQEFGREDERLVHSPDRLALQAAISGLAPGYRLIIYLHDIFGYEHHEIAEIMSCSIGNSKSQLHKARLKIRAQLLAWQAEQRVLRDDCPEAAAWRKVRRKWKKKIPSTVGVALERGLRFGW